MNLQHIAALSTLEDFQKLLDANPDPCLLLDTDHLAISLANESFLNLFGFSKDKLGHITFANLLPRDATYDVATLAEQLGEYGVIVDSMELAIQGKSQTMDITARMLQHQGPGEERLFMVLRNVKAEEEIGKKAGFDSVRLSSLELMAGGLANELNNALTMVLGNVQIAEGEELESNERMELLQEAEKGCHKIEELSKRLIYFSSGGHVVKIPISLALVVKSKAEELLKNKEVELFFNGSSENTWIKADSQQMEHLVEAIVSNALKAMENVEAEPVLRIDCSNVLVNSSSESSLKPGAYVSVLFSDVGCGISAQAQRRLLEPFYSTWGRRGIGLSTAYGIVDKHGGTLRVTSKEGEGTSVEILLPAYHESLMGEMISDSEDNTTQSKTPSSLNGKRILLMDDELGVLRVMQSVIKRLDVTCCTCSNGEEAIELYQASCREGRPYDLVIFDLNIKGGMGGVEAMRAIRNKSGTVKGIICSGFSHDPVITNYEDYGFQAALTKPFSKEALRSVIVRLICHV